MPPEHSLSVWTGPKGEVSLSGLIPANWPLICDLVSSLASAMGLVIHKSTDEQTEALGEKGMSLKSHRRLVFTSRCLESPTQHSPFNRMA